MADSQTNKFLITATAATVNMTLMYSLYSILCDMRTTFIMYMELESELTSSFLCGCLSDLQRNFRLEPWSTFCCPVSEGAVLINDVVEGQGDDEEGAVTGRVHLERHIALVQLHCLSLLCQGRLKQLPRHLGAKMESVNVAKRLQKASCNQKAPGLKPATANISIKSKVSLTKALIYSFSWFVVAIFRITTAANNHSKDLNDFYSQDVTHNTHNT